jgi:hypothetical protein
MSKFKNDFVLEPTSNIRVFTGAQILRYKTTENPSQGQVFYLNPNLIPSTPKLVARLNERICMQRITGVDSRLRLIMTIISENALCANSTNFISNLEKDELRYCLGVLNSKLVNFYFKLTSTNTNITTKEINSIPIPNYSKSSIPLLVTYILTLNNEPSITNYKNIIEDLEELIDSLVFELYFKEEFIEKSLQIEVLIKEIFKSIEHLNHSQKLTTIIEAHKNLKKDNNKLKNQIELMKIELKELVIPILNL